MIIIISRSRYIWHCYNFPSISSLSLSISIWWVHRAMMGSHGRLWPEVLRAMQSEEPAAGPAAGPGYSRPGSRSGIHRAQPRAARAWALARFTRWWPVNWPVNELIDQLMTRWWPVDGHWLYRYCHYHGRGDSRTARLRRPRRPVMT